MIYVYIYIDNMRVFYYSLSHQNHAVQTKQELQEKAESPWPEMEFYFLASFSLASQTTVVHELLSVS